jgi:chromosome segregation ATPase
MEKEPNKKESEKLNFYIESDPNYALIRRLDGSIVRHANDQEEKLYSALKRTEEEIEILKAQRNGFRDQAKEMKELYDKVLEEKKELQELDKQWENEWAQKRDTILKLEGKTKRLEDDNKQLLEDNRRLRETVKEAWDNQEKQYWKDYEEYLKSKGIKP